MKRAITITFLLICTSVIGFAQENNNTFNQVDANGNRTRRGDSRTDSTDNDKEVPIGQYVWTVDRRFGDIIKAEPDTVPHMFMNDGMAYGLRGEYNYTGNEGSPRYNRIFTDQPEPEQNIFAQNYDYFITAPDKLHFINTLSPFTNISYFTNGSKEDGTDRIKAIFAVNANKKLGLGFKLDYLYARGYYENTNSSQFNATLFSSYRGDRYQMHFILSTNRQKQSENGGVENDIYITHPEATTTSYKSDEIPCVLDENWNRNNNQHLFFTQRYSVGFNHKVKMTDAEIKAKAFAEKSAKANIDKEGGKKGRKEDGKRKDDGQDRKDNGLTGGRPEGATVVEGIMPQKGDTAAQARIKVNSRAVSDSLMALARKAHNDSMTMKNEFVPVTSFIHTMEIDNYDHIYEAYQTPTNYYANTYYNKGKLTGDSIYDETKHFSIKNTFAIALLEGFNKYAKAGLKVFATHELRHFSLPDSTGLRSRFNEHNISIGGELSKRQGKLLHYGVIAEAFLVGADSKQLKIDGHADLNIPLFKDTLHIEGRAKLHSLNPTFYYRHYHGKHLWWDNSDMAKETRARVEGTISYPRTGTSLRIAIEEVKNHAYFSQTYAIDSTSYARTGNDVTVKQASGNINIITAQLRQNFKLGPLRWENEITYQNSSNQDVIPLPTLNIYSNVFLNFRVAKVLLVDLGADVRFFTKYYAPDYSAALNQYCVQSPDMERVKIGEYPIINAYANFHLKHTRFFVMMSHINCGSGNGCYFLTPHYPVNPMVLHLGVSWNFFN
jgi:hypothetical protein